ncbi:hypothetical protein NMY22_g4305 [Coprinellus aureogranulatus]|nr:hypothetical protein NMY22_g4305 [Coprinellus aureogranulatus]
MPALILPFNLPFPPLPVKQEVEIDSATDDEDEDDPHLISKETSPVRSTGSRKSFSSTHRSAFSDENGELLEEHRWLSMQGLLQQSSPYISLDATKGYAFTPSKKSSFTSASGKDKGRKRRQSRLPNKTLNIDLRTLNLHLHLRAKEVVGCSESMWEWVQETQRAWKREQESQRMNGRGHSLDISHRYRSESSLGDGPPDHKSKVLEMAREDFNQLLLNFEMDMQDQASLNNALKERFQWNVMDSAPPQNRKIFNIACEKYDKWQQESRNRVPSFSSVYRPSRNSLQAPSSINITAPTPDTPAKPDAPPVAKGRARSNSHTVLSNRNVAANADRSTALPSIALAPSRSDASTHFSAVPELAASSTARSNPEACTIDMCLRCLEARRKPQTETVDFLTLRSSLPLLTERLRSTCCNYYDRHHPVLNTQSIPASLPKTILACTYPSPSFVHSRVLHYPRLSCSFSTLHQVDGVYWRQLQGTVPSYVFRIFSRRQQEDVPSLSALVIPFRKLYVKKQGAFGPGWDLIYGAMRFGKLSGSFGPAGTWLCGLLRLLSS